MSLQQSTQLLRTVSTADDRHCHSLTKCTICKPRTPLCRSCCFCCHDVANMGGWAASRMQQPLLSSQCAQHVVSYV